ncbi:MULTISPECIES: sugar ABC transporter substrate-binding protein [Streptomyces]|jgi:simple sugar transport system substrate-binding protein|uniref:Simple sugar transport system substrate-binding protein n=2 Tax=Streptomyces TaxID=1883 RepID=A0A514JK66_9ACTN|nr:MULTISPECIES: sugar ABC transporter substrate-binding protein [Streptomyces]MBA8941815.1 simple sugar transport system substrate-binding protein [Streptomyces calvus]MBA8976252.1 simple sugar transport system substrate-binding protein [Streptomyces calvus]MYS29461.1 substrate-binding domain-containing protein [Streptomyces sp. SID7804]QDI67736.1 sugar ABC transporter substrate-binding protein [Streptomyces calvus]GGP61608.1 sugar ABC transporter substrate-binding protein [Streptomyces calvu
MDRSSHIRLRRVAPFTAVAAAAALALAGCSSGSGGKKAEEGGADASAGKANTPRMTVALVTHQAPGDTFWDIVRKGAEAAAAKDNVKLVYSADPNAGSQATLVQNAIDQKVDGIAVTLAKPDALKDVIAKAKAAGIPVVGLNSGLSDWKDLGLLEFFGQDESVAGEAFGKKLNEVGAKNAVCVIHEQGNVGLTQRCDGVKKTFEGNTQILNVNGTDMPSVKSTITAKLKQDSAIDHVITLGAPFAPTAVQSVGDAGSEAKVATFDLNKDLTKAIEAGDIEFAVDQQPYLQGYLAVDGLWLYKNNGNYSGGGEQPVLTGPAFVDKSNVDAVSEYAAKGTR